MGAKVSPELPIGGEINEEAPVDLIEIVGVIKWFDASKGYGFIVPETAGLPDVLLHVTCLRRGGFPDRLRRRAGRRRSAEPEQGPAGLPRRQHGRDRPRFGRRR